MRSDDPIRTKSGQQMKHVMLAYLESNNGIGGKVFNATVSDVEACGGGNVANQSLREETANTVGAADGQDVDVLQQTPHSKIRAEQDTVPAANQTRYCPRCKHCDKAANHRSHMQQLQQYVDSLQLMSRQPAYTTRYCCLLAKAIAADIACS